MFHHRFQAATSELAAGLSLVKLGFVDPRLSCSVAPILFPPFFVAQKWSSPKRVPFFAMVTERVDNSKDFRGPWGHHSFDFLRNVEVSLGCFPWTNNLSLSAFDDDMEWVLGIV